LRKPRRAMGSRWGSFAIVDVAVNIFASARVTLDKYFPSLH
jgi:hypothetical protein